MWAEWAKVEYAGGSKPYTPPSPANDYAALLVSLARQEHPDTSAYSDPEIVWRMQLPHHVGMILKSPDRGRVTALLNQYVERVQRDFASVEPPRNKPTN
jgi:hypothetical protein